RVRRAGPPLPEAAAAVFHGYPGGPLAGGRLRAGDAPAPLGDSRAVSAMREVLDLPVPDREALLVQPAEEGPVPAGRAGSARGQRRQRGLAGGDAAPAVPRASHPAGGGGPPGAVSRRVPALSTGR